MIGKSDWSMIDTYAKSWIKEAGSRIRDSFNKKLLIKTKSNKDDLVTNMDHETEQFLISKITETFPNHQILGEEGFGDEVKALDGVVWIIDPIDGTMNFVHQQRNFAISIGIYEDGVGQIGLIYDVVNDELYHAKKGQGAFFNDTALPALSDVSVDEAVIGINATWVLENKRIDSSVLTPLVKQVRGTRSYGSAALEMAYVAAGRLDAYITMRLAPWDFAAGMILIAEVGGVVTNIKGQPVGLLNESSVFASNGNLHKEVMKNYIEGFI
ncbi:inositol monophosphatase family protein [Bacillus salitolerans]|uniref:inositol-phosphate phosphatase n=1 Tax=Bacillus salitolerans TaxID=1437434 RepID=A0ABW4LKC2_9BACI